ncbi:hypothetical protein E2C01_060735 [Portunus trituberculatus]|uniref:Uncharacterized protein n=1 Tax=Portunus trituberculatus TaxID=210409 RepID=A0A5B7H9I5_PORTR|nr:hypothetical protein [Portunus trituberculatus]
MGVTLAVEVRVMVGVGVAREGTCGWVAVRRAAGVGAAWRRWKSRSWWDSERGGEGAALHRMWCGVGHPSLPPMFINARLAKARTPFLRVGGVGVGAGVRLEGLRPDSLLFLTPCEW